jgi:VanZ family protein
MAVVLGLGSSGFQADHTSRVLMPLLEWLLPDWKPWELRQIHVWIRKLAHAFEYGVTGLLVFRAFLLTRPGWSVRRVSVSAWLLVVLLACTDEVRQSTLTTRTGTASDVALDAAGGALAVVLAPRWIRRPRAGDDA